MATKQELRDAALAEYKKVERPAWAEYKKRLEEIDAMSEDPDVAAAIKLLEGCGYKVSVD